MIRKCLCCLLLAAAGATLMLGCGGSSAGPGGPSDKQREKDKPGKK